MKQQFYAIFNQTQIIKEICKLFYLAGLWFPLYSLVNRVSDFSPIKGTRFATDFPCPTNHSAIIFTRIFFGNYFTQLHA